MNCSSQEKKYLMHSRLGRVKPKLTTSSSQTMRAKTGGERKFHSWKPPKMTLLLKTQRHQSHMNMSKQTPLSTHLPQNTPQIPRKMTNNFKTVVWNSAILKLLDTALVNLCQTKHQMMLFWICLRHYRQTAVWQSLRDRLFPKAEERREKTAIMKKAPRWYWQLTSNMCLQLVRLQYLLYDQLTHFMSLLLKDIKPCPFKKIVNKLHYLYLYRQCSWEAATQTQTKAKDSGIEHPCYREDTWRYRISGYKKAWDFLWLHSPLSWYIQQHH